MTEKEITKLKRAIYIWENIGIGMNSTTKEKALKIKQSFSNPGNPYDNAVMESFFATLKREEVHRKNTRITKI